MKLLKQAMHSSLTVGHIWSSAKSMGSTIIIIKIIIYSTAATARGPAAWGEALKIIIIISGSRCS